MLLLFEYASLVTATARDAEVAELNRKLLLANADLNRVNQRLDETQGMRPFFKSVSKT